MLIQENISLLPYNTFRMDVRARYRTEYASPDELSELLLRFADMRRLFIGQRSNLLFTGDFDGVVLHSAMTRARAVRETAGEVFIEAQSGLVMDQLIDQLCDMGLYGLENLSHIPGEVGAAAVQNVGAYGVEAKDVISEVQALDTTTRRLCTLTNADCRFGYRDSVFKNEAAGRYVITSVTFRLSKKPVYHLDYGRLRDALTACPSPSEIREAVIRIRRDKLPEVSRTGSAGSFFKNPVVGQDMFEGLRLRYPDMPCYMQDDGVKIPAAWLIEQSGCKGLSSGGVAVYDRQPLVIVNNGHATPDDVIRLAQQIQDLVRERFGITLQREVVYV